MADTATNDGAVVSSSPRARQLNECAAVQALFDVETLISHQQLEDDCGPQSQTQQPLSRAHCGSRSVHQWQW